MKINTFLELIYNNYNLKNLYYKYIFFLMLSILIKEIFYWSLLYFNQLIKNNENKIKYYSNLLLFIFSLSIPIEKIFNNIKFDFLKSIKIAINDFFITRLNNLYKKSLLDIDLVEYNNTLEKIFIDIESYINRIKYLFEIVIKFNRIILITINKKFSLILLLFFVFFILIDFFNKDKIITEDKLLIQFFNLENILRNYIINSKFLLINDIFNKKYVNNKKTELEDVNYNINQINNVLDMKSNLLLLLFVIIIIYNKINQFTTSDFINYFFVIYDIEFIVDRINEIYKNKIFYLKVEERINYLYNFKLNNNTKNNSNTKITNFKITSLNNKNPFLKLLNNIIVNNNDKILIEGVSGSGKSSFYNILKGILKPDEIKININLNDINNQTFLTLANYKNIYSDYLYNIISDYNEINNDLINQALQYSKFNITENKYININEISSGEKNRLYIAKIIYLIKSNNDKYNILLFDEIDENLSDKLALEICENILNLFNDKIVFYITHNNKVKTIFKNKININNGYIKYNKN